jgi:hypothetical protein
MMCCANYTVHQQDDVLCKDETVSQKRFGVVKASLGTVYTHAFVLVIAAVPNIRSRQREFTGDWFARDKQRGDVDRWASSPDPAVPQ